MAAITVQLSAEDHRLLRLYCLSTGKSQDEAIAELLHTELDRALPGKREALRAVPDTAWEALGTTPPEPGSEAHQWATEIIASLRNHDQVRHAA